MITYNTIGFLLLGAFLGMVLFSLMSIFMFRSTTKGYVEKETGDYWHLKDIARDTSNRVLYILQSSRDCTTLAVTKEELSQRWSSK